MDVRIDDKGNIDASATGLEAVQAQAQVLAAHIRGRLIMGLGLYVLAAVFVITASLLVVFAPDGREVATSIIAAALFALAVGVAGFSAFKIKTPIVSAEASGAAPDATRQARDTHGREATNLEVR